MNVELYYKKRKKSYLSLAIVLIPERGCYLLVYVQSQMGLKNTNVFHACPCCRTDQKKKEKDMNKHVCATSPVF